MRSRHADRFNHNEDAANYDSDVLSETDPIRAGYDAVLDWVANEVNARRCKRIVELGMGTGNLSARLTAFDSFVGVDISTEMIALARRKLAVRRGVEYLADDLLGFFDKKRGRFDAVASTYAIHHLLEAEKYRLFENIDAVLSETGIMVFGDLMFRDEGHRQRFIREATLAGDGDLVDTVNDEFFWNLSAAEQVLAALGYRTTVRQFSELSWGISAEKSCP